MKVMIKELQLISHDNWYEHYIFNGECEVIQFCQHDKNIKQPDFISMSTDGTLQVIYDKDSNVRIEIDEDKTAWCRPVMLPETLTKLIEENKLKEVK